MHAQLQEQNIALLAQRFPLLIVDLQKSLASDPNSAQAPKHPSQPIPIDRIGGIALLDCYQPDQTLEKLNTLPGENNMLHLFASAGHLLLFLSQPDARQCIEDLRWEPLLLQKAIGESEHFMHWLETHEPHSWPWLLAVKNVDMGNCFSLADKLGKHLLKLVEGNCANYAEKFLPNYQNRPEVKQILKAGERPLRVMLLAGADTSYQRFCARDMQEALNANDVETYTVLFNKSPWWHCDTYQGIIKFDPDVLLLNGRDRRELHYLPDNLCVVSWDQDHCIGNQDYLKYMRPKDRLMVMVEDWISQAVNHGIPTNTVSHLNLGTNTKIYYPQASKQTAKPKYDVLFVGNTYTLEQYKPLIQFSKISDDNQNIFMHALGLLEQWVDAQNENSKHIIPDCHMIIDQTFDELNQSPINDDLIRKHFFYFLRYRLAHMLLRNKYLAALGDYKLGLFGKGWQNVPQVADQAQGVIDNGDDLRQAIYDSAIVLHLHTWTVHHPRLYDTAAAGGFLLVGRVPELNEISSVYKLGKELDTFGSIAELKNKINYYLKHTDERQAMASRAAKRTEREHTMTKRMQQMLRMLKQDDQSDQQQDNPVDAAHSAVSA